MRVMRIVIFGRRFFGARLWGNTRSRGRNFRFCMRPYTCRGTTQVLRIVSHAYVVRFESLKHRATIDKYTSVKEATLVRRHDDGVFRSRY